MIMLKLDDLRPAPGSNTRKKRVGRGDGSGKGKTSGRGTKGQKARSGGNVRPGFEGGQNPIYRRMPYKRGFKNPFRVEYEIVNLAEIEERQLESPISPESLYAGRVVRDDKRPVKVLGDGEISRPITIRAHKFSTTAREKIEAAGGVVEVIE
jgi:large subunit ribosomal protein L15